jgi:hypothetical protein
MVAENSFVQALPACHGSPTARWLVKQTGAPRYCTTHAFFLHALASSGTKSGKTELSMRRPEHKLSRESDQASSPSANAKRHHRHRERRASILTAATTGSSVA